MKVNPIYINACTSISALGAEHRDINACLAGKKTPNIVRDNKLLVQSQNCYVGKIKPELLAMPLEYKNYASRNNALIYSVLTPIESQIRAMIARFGAARVAVLVGTSTSGIADGEAALKHKLAHGNLGDNYSYSMQEIGNAAEFIAKYFAITGPSYTISTACSSSARVFISASRLLDADIVDAVIVGGADTLCRLSVNGFKSLESLAKDPCQPFSATRSGITIGEAGAFMLLSKEKPKKLPAIALLGCGESSDAHHISAPHPAGDGAKIAMQRALDRAGLLASDIGYINAHGTATKLNDSMEALAIGHVFGKNTPVSSTKPLTGHTLGAAGAMEAAIAWHILNYNLDLPQQYNCREQDPLLDINLIMDNQKIKQPVILSNSFAFGGNNAALIIGRVE